MFLPSDFSEVSCKRPLEPSLEVQGDLFDLLVEI